MRAHFHLRLGAERGSVPVHAVALATVLWAMFAARTFTVRLLSIVTCALQFTLMFWRPESRFGLLAWLMTVVTIIALSGEACHKGRAVGRTFLEGTPPISAGKLH